MSVRYFFLFNFDWLEAQTPTPEDLDIAVKELPSCDKPKAAEY